MKIIESDTIEDFKTEFDKAPLTGEYFYRGQADSGWSLKSGLTRRKDNIDLKSLLLSEDRVMEKFKCEVSKHSLSHLIPKNGSYGENWNFWMAGQHYGLPTRLIDFSGDKYCALQFAVMDLEHYDKPGALFLYRNNVSAICEIKDPFTAFKVSGMLQVSSVYMPDCYDEAVSERRKLIQRSKFFYCANDLINKPIDEAPAYSSSVSKLIIKQEFKLGLIEYLIKQTKFDKNLYVQRNKIDHIAAMIKDDFCNNKL
jgi:hypothetical protein